MYRRGSRQRWLAVIGVVVLALGVVMTIRWFGSDGEPASAEAEMAANSDGAAPAAQGTSPTKAAESGSQRGADRTVGSTPKSNTSPNVGNAGAREPEKISMGGKTGSAPGTTPAPTSTPGSLTPHRETASSSPPAPPAVMPPLAPPTVIPDPPASVNPGAAAAPPQPARGDSASASSTPSTPSSSTRPAPTPSSAPSNASAQQRIDLGLELIKQNKPVEARRTLSEALATSGISPADAERVRGELTRLNERLIFGPETVAGDPFVSAHKIESGDSLAKLPKKLDLDVDWRFLQRINKISDPARIQAGQRIKTVKGPFHAVVDKRAFRMDLYLGDGSERVYVRSFSVGLGEYGATPEGAFTVKPNSKLVDPAWTNPRTGEHFASGDPKNPLGKYWIGLIGASDNIRGLESYGIHGTIEPESVGQERSMGCVRMLADDVKLVYEVLMDNVSRVEIHGADWP